MNIKNYYEPKNLIDLDKILKKESNYELYSGGTDILGLLKDGIIQTDNLVGLKKCEELNGISIIDKKWIRIGASVTLSKIADNETISNYFPDLKNAILQISSPQLRNCGTIGGNLCQRPRCYYFRSDFNCLRKGGDICYAVDGNNKNHCIINGVPCFITHPSDMAVILTALKSKIGIYSNGKRNEVDIKDFFILPETNSEKENILKKNEVIEYIHIPMSGNRFTYHKVREREVWDFAIVSSCISFEKLKNKIKSVNIVLGGVSPIPYICNDLNEKIIELQEVESIGNWVDNYFLKQASPLEMNSYKITIVRSLIKSQIEEILYDS